jgi:hypothetical protein
LFKLGLFHSTKSQYDEAILVNDLWTSKLESG